MDPLLDGSGDTEDGDAAEELERFKLAVAEYRYLTGIRDTVLLLAERHGPLDEELRDRLERCEQSDRILKLALEVGDAKDSAAVERAFATLREEPEYDD